MPQHTRDKSFLAEAFDYLKSKARRFSKWFTSLFDFGKKAWEEHVPMTKEKAVRMLTRGLPRGTKVKVKVDSDGHGSIDMEANYIEEVNKTFDLDSKVAHSGYMKLEKTGNGIGRKIMRNQIEFFIASGIEKLEMLAGLDAGGYTWARLGFLPYNKGAYKEDFMALKKEITQRYKKLAPLLDSREKAKLEKALEFKDPKDLWRVADTRIDLNKKLRKVFNAAANDDKRAQRLQENISEIVNSEEVQGDKPLPIGRILLAGTSWEGELDFNNKAQMKRVSDYVGGLQIQPPAKAPKHAAAAA